jgi:hypothetical protein
VIGLVVCAVLLCPVGMHPDPPSLTTRVTAGPPGAVPNSGASAAPGGLASSFTESAPKRHTPEASGRHSARGQDSRAHGNWAHGAWEHDDREHDDRQHNDRQHNDREHNDRQHNERPHRVQGRGPAAMASRAPSTGPGGGVTGQGHTRRGRTVRPSLTPSGKPTAAPSPGAIARHRSRASAPATHRSAPAPVTISRSPKPTAPSTRTADAAASRRPAGQSAAVPVPRSDPLQIHFGSLGAGLALVGVGLGFLALCLRRV